jgi:FtsZ-binding cell division protein ZapB
MAEREAHELIAPPCTFSTALEKRVTNMEISLREIDKSNAVNGVVLEKLETTASRLTDTIQMFMETVQELKQTMISMQGEIRSNRDETSEIKDSLEQVKTSISKNEEKGRIEIMPIFKTVFSNGLVWFLSGGGIVWAIISVINQLTTK